MSIKILTDSTSDISKELAKELDVTLVPLRVIFENEDYLDGVDITIDQFYERLVKAKVLPTTSQPTPEQFLPYYEAARDNNDTLIVITISSKLSGTYQSAQIAKDIVDYTGIHIIDSETVTLGLQLLVREALALRNRGLSGDDIAKELEAVKKNIRLLALVESLEYLKKGGRLSSVSAFAGGLLNIKPIIEVKDGLVGVAGKARGLTGAYKKLAELITSNEIDLNREVCIGYSAGKDTMNGFLDHSKNDLGIQDFIESPIGSVVGTHAGPGACGIAFFTKN
ncbi:MAG: degV family protein [Anaerocolumna sp.]|jgi:DegV family protein with EDD domain|nr:degV family protein [Anaerocolumna sp.]